MGRNPRLLPRLSLALCLLVWAGLAGCSLIDDYNERAAMVVSVSSDGRYAVSSHRNLRIVLWDLERRKKKIISRNANKYSAYFIKGQDVLLWQDMDDVVHVQNVAGEVLRTFHSFPVYGHVAGPDLEPYVASDDGWGLWVGYGQGRKQMKWGEEGTGFGKLFNLSLSPNGQWLVSAGFGGPANTPPYSIEAQAKKGYADLEGTTLWCLPCNAPEVKLFGNMSKTYATFTPDGQAVLSGSETTRPRLWDMEQRAVTMQVDWLSSSVPYPPAPEGFDLGHHQATLWLGFIDDGEHFLRINTYEPYALLYHVDRPQLIKYIPLGERPRPSVDRYARNAAFDTAPAAGLLVTGQEYGSGINVYQYHPDKQTLELLWSPR